MLYVLLIKRFLFLLLTLCSVSALSQDDFPVNGVRNKNNNVHAFIDATIHVDAEMVVQNGYLIIKQDEIT